MQNYNFLNKTERLSRSNLDFKQLNSIFLDIELFISSSVKNKDLMTNLNDKPFTLILKEENKLLNEKLNLMKIEYEDKIKTLL